MHWNLYAYASRAVLCCVLWGALGAAATAQEETPDAVRHLSEAIRYKTISHQDPAQFDPAPFRAFLRFLERAYPNVFTQLEVTRIAEFSLVAKWQGSNPSLKPVLFDGHYDVVPVEPGTEADWNFDPFSGEITDEYILGRGAIDNKSAIIALFEGFEALLAEGFQPTRTVYFSLGHDEEIGGGEGAANIAAHLKSQHLEFEFMFAEGGFLIQGFPLYPQGLVAQVSLAQKGYLTLILNATGEGGHSSTPTQDNALVRLSEAVAKLHHNPFPAKLVSPFSDMLEVLAPHVGGLKGFVIGNQWLTKPLLVRRLSNDPSTSYLVRTTTAVTMFHAGIKENQIPQRAEARVNFRLLPGDTQASVIAEVRTIIDDDQITITTGLNRAAPKLADRNGAGFAKIEKALKSVVPDVLVVPGLLPAMTDSVHYEAMVGEVYHFQPHLVVNADLRSIHGTNERVRVDSVIRSVSIAKALIKEAGVK